MQNIPEEGSIWVHRTGAGDFYTILGIANIAAEDPVEFPVTVCYRDKDSRIWSQKLDTWTGNMRDCSDIVKPGQTWHINGHLVTVKKVSFAVGASTIRQKVVYFEYQEKQQAVLLEVWLRVAVPEDSSILPIGDVAPMMNPTVED